jgi:hypothetical protein
MSDPFVEFMDPLRVLRERIEAAFTECGLKPMHVGIVPGTSTDGPHEIHMLAVLADETPPADDGFEQVLADARDADTEERAKAALDDLQDRLRGSKGFLDDATGDE